jgi:hypothetical protein
MANLQACINELRAMALADDASTRIISTYLGAVFSFSDGNCNRPDIPTNATISEGLAWNKIYTSRGVGQPIPQFKVFHHKTSNDHGAQKIALSEQDAQLLSQYVEGNIHAANWSPCPLYFRMTDKPRKSEEVSDVSPKLFDFPVGGFSAVWTSVRRKNPSIKDVTNTAVRHFVETKVSMIIILLPIGSLCT